MQYKLNTAKAVSANFNLLFKGQKGHNTGRKGHFRHKRDKTRSFRTKGDDRDICGLFFFFAEMVFFLLRSQTVNMAKCMCREFPIPNCGATYLVKLSNHLTDVHELDYINRRKWLQEAKLQPTVRVMIYPAKRSQGLRRSRSETPLSVQEEEKDTIVHQLSKPRGVKKSLKSLPRGVGKAANTIKHCKTTADSVPEWRNLYGDDEGPNTEKRA